MFVYLINRKKGFTSTTAGEVLCILSSIQNWREAGCPSLVNEMWACLREHVQCRRGWAHAKRNCTGRASSLSCIVDVWWDIYWSTMGKDSCLSPKESVPSKTVFLSSSEWHCASLRPSFPLIAGEWDTAIMPGAHCTLDSPLNAVQQEIVVHVMGSANHWKAPDYIPPAQLFL